MIDHLGLQCVDVKAVADFYQRVFGACGLREVRRIETPAGPVIGLAGPDGAPQLWVSPAEDTGHRPVHLALSAPSRDAVEEVYAAALAIGAEILHAPRMWPEYHAGYFAVFLRDPDGNNVEAVHHTLGS